MVEAGFDQCHHLHGDGFALVLLGSQGGKLGCSFQHGCYLLIMEGPGEAIEGVPCPNTIDVVADGFAQKQACECGDKG